MTMTMMKVFGIASAILFLVLVGGVIHTEVQRSRLGEGVKGNYTVISHFVMCSKREGCRLIATMENEDQVILYDFTPDCFACTTDELYSVYVVGSRHELYYSEVYVDEYYKREEFDEVIQSRRTLYRRVAWILGGVALCDLVVAIYIAVEYERLTLSNESLDA